MAYFVQTVESVEEYLTGIESLSAEGRRQLIEGYSTELSERADHFLARYPLAHEAYTFQYEYVMVDGTLIFSFRFIVDASVRAMGVVRVIYVDYETMPIPSR